VYAKLWVTTHQEMHMIGHLFNANQVLSPLLDGFKKYLFQPHIYAIDQNLASVLWAKDDVIVTIENTIYVMSSYYIHV